MNDPSGHDRIAAGYRRFAAEEARGRSPLYEALAEGVAADPDILEFLSGLPMGKRQPNLLLGAVRYLFGTASGYAEFRRRVLDNAEAVRRLMLSRSTQTNEPGRCAVLLPILAALPQPLALIEVGASAGLCLLPDCYGYDYCGHRLNAAANGPVFPCCTDAATPRPTALPQIVWRAGLDLDPVDLSDPDRVAWLKALVWPEQEDRLARLCTAIEIASGRKPRVAQGDLRSDLAALAAEAPESATRVVFHTAVLNYVPADDRAEFVRSIGALCDVWIANEAPQIFPEIAATVGAAGPPGSFLISVNGEPIAWADPHGAWLRWIAALPGSRL